MVEETKDTDMLRYIVVGIDDEMKIVGQYDSEGEAKKTAENMAGKYDGTSFAVYQSIGSAKLEHKILWKGAGR